MKRMNAGVSWVLGVLVGLAVIAGGAVRSEAQSGGARAACMGPALVAGDTVLQLCRRGAGNALSEVSLSSGEATLMDLPVAEGVGPTGLAGAALRADGAVGLVFAGSDGALRVLVARDGGAPRLLASVSEGERPLGVGWSSGAGGGLQILVGARDAERAAAFRLHSVGSDGSVATADLDWSPWCPLFGGAVAWPAGATWDVAFVGLGGSAERCVGATQAVDSRPAPGGAPAWAPWTGGGFGMHPVGNLVPGSDGPRVVGAGGDLVMATAVFLGDPVSAATVLSMDAQGGTRLELPDGRVAGVTLQADSGRHVLTWLGEGETVPAAAVSPDLALIPRPGGGFALYRGGAVVAWLDDALTEVDTP
jgi:hypothetical protein